MDFQDLMKGVDYVVDKGIADEDCLGVMGWSYGGFMSAWIIGHTDRFKVASVGAAIIDTISMEGTSEDNLLLSEYFGGHLWDDYDFYLTHSPIYYVKNITTPALIQHGQEDIMVPLTQGEEFCNALSKMSKVVKMVVYPRSGHVPEEPKTLRAVMKDNQEWFHKYIPPNE